MWARGSGSLALREIILIIENKDHLVFSLFRAQFSRFIQLFLILGVFTFHYLISLFSVSKQIVVVLDKVSLATLQLSDLYVTKSFQL